MITLFQHQITVLESTLNYTRVGYFLEMGLGKTFIASEKMKQLNTPNTLLVCQKSKLTDWLEHFKKYYPEYNSYIYKTKFQENSIAIINYDSVWRRPDLLKLKNFTLILDESQYIKNATANRTKFILKLNPQNVILLSGTPVGGKYEELLTQCKLLGWNISKKDYYKNYVVTTMKDFGMGFPVEVVVGYKNIDHLKEVLKSYGAIFMKSEEAITLPESIESTHKVPNTKLYKDFLKFPSIKIGDHHLVGENSLTKLLSLRQLASLYNENKYTYVKDLLESSLDRFVIFYNFKEEFNKLKELCTSLKRPISYINGNGTDLKNYEDTNESITLVQYQSGSSGVNLQLSNKIIYFSPTLSAEMYMQSKARIRRIGQTKTCFYYYLITEKSVEERIMQALLTRQDYTIKLFEKEC